MKAAAKVTAKTDDDLRRRELAQIHIAKSQLQMSEDSYRAVLWAKGRVTSSAELDFTGRKRVLDHMRACGFKPGAAKKGRAHPGRPHQIGSSSPVAAQLGKVEALLADARRPWAYADGMCQRMFKVERVAFCNGEQLQKLIAALVVDQKRRAEHERI